MKKQLTFFVLLFMLCLTSLVAQVGYTALSVTINSGAGGSGTGGYVLPTDVLGFDITLDGAADTVRIGLQQFGPGDAAIELTNVPATFQWVGNYTVPTGDDQYTIPEYTVYLISSANGDSTFTNSLAAGVDNQLPEVLDMPRIILAGDDDGNGIADFNNLGADSLFINTNLMNVVGADWDSLEVYWGNAVGDTAKILIGEGGYGAPIAEGPYDWDPMNPDTLTVSCLVFDEHGNSWSFTIPADSTNILIDNNVPVWDSTNAFFSITHTSRAIEYAKIGDIITAHYRITPGDNVELASFDFENVWDIGLAVPTQYTAPGNAFVTGDTLVDNTIEPDGSGGEWLTADHVVALGDCDNCTDQYIANLGVDVTLLDMAGNSYYAQAGISGIDGAPDDTIRVVSRFTDLSNAEDIQNTGYLRFSPESPTVPGYSDEPDTLRLKMKIEDWCGAAPSDPIGIVLRIEHELTRDVVGMVQFDSTTVDYWDPATDTLYFTWNGEDPNNPGTFLPEGTYGLTLWEVLDRAGNNAILNYAPETNYPDIDTTHTVKINAVHAVIDNTPPSYFSPFTVVDSLTGTAIVDTVYRRINDVDGSGDLSAGDTFVDFINPPDFTFGVERDFYENTELLRHEFVDYWVELIGPTNNGDTLFFWEGSDPQGDVWTPQEVNFATLTHIRAYVGETGDIRWRPTEWDSSLVDGFAEGEYTITSYVHDTAGNILRSPVSRSTIYLKDVLYRTPVVDSIRIVSQHDGGVNGLDPFDANGHHNFYLNAYWEAFPDSLYYMTNDTMSVEIELADITYLDSLVIVDNHPFNFTNGNVYYPADFVGNVLTIDYVINELDIRVDSTLADTLFNVGDTLSILTYDNVNPGAAIVCTATPDTFNLLLPPEPVWPDTSNIDVVISEERISPGFYTHGYDADTNPARDMLLDSCNVKIDFTFDNPLDQDFTWFIDINDSVSTESFRDSGLVVANGVDDTFSIDPVLFYGLENTFNPIIGEFDNGLLDVKVWAVSAAYGDEGYVNPPSEEEATISLPLWVDNTNPDVTNTVSWHGTPGFITDEEMVVAPNVPYFTFEITTDEPLAPNTPGGTPGEFWTAIVVDTLNGNPIDMGDGDITTTLFCYEAGDTLTVDGVTGPTSFKMIALFGNIPTSEGGGFDEAFDPVLVIRSINDFAGNPNRVNDPAYPPTEDLFNNDSNEAYIKFMVLEHKTQFGFVSHTYHLSESIEAPWIVDPADTMDVIGYVSNVKNPNTFDFSVEVLGMEYNDFALTVNGAPISRDHDDISTALNINFSGPYSGIVVDSVSYDTLWTTFTDSSRILVVNLHDVEFFDFPGYSNGDTLAIDMRIDLDFGGDIAWHEYAYETEIEIIVDVEQPVIELQQPVFISSPRDIDMNEYSTYRIPALVSDALSGVHLASGLLTCTTDTLIAFQDSCTVADSDSIYWEISIPDTYPIRTLEFVATVEDTVANLGTDTILWDIGAIPYVTIDSVYNSHPDVNVTDWLNNGQPVHVSFTITDSERVESIQIKLNTESNEAAVDTYVNIPTWVEGLNTFDFTNVNNAGTLPDSADVIATIFVTHPYDHTEDDSTYVSAVDLLKIDDENPSVVINDPVFVSTPRSPDMLENSTYSVVVEYMDLYAGLDDATHSLVCDDPGLTITLHDSVTTRSDELTITYYVQVPADHPNRIATFTATISDNVLNVGSAQRIWDIGLVPEFTIDDFDNATSPYDTVVPDFIKNGQHAQLSLTLSDPERIERMEVSLNTEFSNTARSSQLRNGRASYAANEIYTLTGFTAADVNYVVDFYNLNNLNTLATGDNVIASVKIYHDYDHSSDSTVVAQTSNLGWLRIDNDAPNLDVASFDYDIDWAPDFMSAAIHFEVDIADQTAETLADVVAPDVKYDLVGINSNTGNAGIHDADDSNKPTWELDLTWPLDFNPLADTLDNGQVVINHEDQLDNIAIPDTFVIDTKPVIDDVIFYVVGTPSDVILENDHDVVTVEVNITATTDHMLPYFVDVMYDGNPIIFDYDNVLQEVTDLGTGLSEYKYTYDVEFALDTDTLYVQAFDVDVYSVFFLDADTYIKEMIVIPDPAESIRGQLPEVARNSYSGLDPWGWFAPEHNVQLFVHTYSQTEMTVDNFEANFWHVSDFEPESWKNPNVSVVNDPFYVHMTADSVLMYNVTAEWNQQTSDAQSIWSHEVDGVRVVDGSELPIGIMVHTLGTTLTLEDTHINVDLNNPAYDLPFTPAFAGSDAGDFFKVDLFKIEEDTTLTDLGRFDANWDALNKTYTLELPLEDFDVDGTYKAPIVMRLYATDTTPTTEYPSVGGAGILEIDAPTVATLNGRANAFEMPIPPYTEDPSDSLGVGDVVYHQFLLTPATGLVHGDVISMTLGSVRDKVNHDEDTQRDITINISADYKPVVESSLRIHNCIATDADDAGSSPFVSPGGIFGMNVNVDHISRSTAIANIEAFVPYLLEETTSNASADSLIENAYYWRPLTTDNDTLYYMDYNPANVVWNGYTDGTELPVRLRVNYANGSSYTTDWIGAPGTAIVDAEAPQLVEDGILIWSETLGYIEEGYVVPEDVNANLRVIFQDNHTDADYPENGKPYVMVDSLENFIDFYTVDGGDLVMPHRFDEWTSIEFFATYNPDPDSRLTFNNVWVASVDSMIVKSTDSFVTTQEVISVVVNDQAGNTTYDPMNPALRMVEITAAGPIVPVIKGMEVIAGDVPANYWAFDPSTDTSFDMFYTADGEGTNVYEALVDINVYTRVRYREFIEDMWLDLSAIGGDSYVQITDIQNYYDHPDSNLFVGHIQIDLPNITRADAQISAHTIRHPFGASEVFTDEFVVTLRQDELNPVHDNVVVSNNHSTYSVDWSFNPDLGLEVVAEFDNVRGLFGDTEHEDWHIDSLMVWDWFYLMNDTSVNPVFDTDNAYYPMAVNIDYPTLLDTERVTVTWTIDSTHVADYWKYGYNDENEYVSFNIHFSDIYGEWRFVNTNDVNPQGILVDHQSPVFNEAFSYGRDNDEPVHYENRTIDFENDDEIGFHLDYNDINAVYSITADFRKFRNPMTSYLQTMFPTDRAIAYFNVDIDGNVFQYNVSKNDTVFINITDNVGNVTMEYPVNTTFILDEDDTFVLDVYDNEDFYWNGLRWYSQGPELKLWAEHEVAGYDLIDNDDNDHVNPLNIDEPGEGLDYSTIEMWINNHINDDWFEFPHYTEVINDTNYYADPFTVFGFQGNGIQPGEPGYNDFSEGMYRVRVEMNNLFGHLLENQVDFYVDQTAPVVSNIHFLGSGTQTFHMNDYINVMSNFDEIHVDFVDSDILGTGVAGVGVDFRNDEFNGDSTRVELWKLNDIQDNTDDELFTAMIQTDDEGNGYVSLEVDPNSRWAAENLPAGYYELRMVAMDLLGNEATYTKQFHYHHTPPLVSLHVLDNNLEPMGGGDVVQVTDEFVHVAVSVDDTVGVVVNVDFELYFDANNNGWDEADEAFDYTRHIMDNEESRDTTVPFEAVWNIMNTNYFMQEMDIDDMQDWDEDVYNEHIDVYNYYHDDLEGLVSPARTWILVATATTNAGAQTTVTREVLVEDNVGPAPTLTNMTNSNDSFWYHNTDTDSVWAYQFVYDFNAPNGNNSLISAICQYDEDLGNVVDHNWPDAWYVDFIITDLNSDWSWTYTNTYMEEGNSNYLCNWNWGPRAIENPGMYKIEAIGYDRLRNSAQSLNVFYAHLMTAGNAWAELEMKNFDIPNWDEIVDLSDPEVYGPFNPIQTLKNLRLDAYVHHMEEVESIGLFYDVYDNVAKEFISVDNVLPNDTDINPDMPAELGTIMPYQMEVDGNNIGVARFVIPEDLYGNGETPDYAGKDYSYIFKIVVRDYTGADFVHEDHIMDMEAMIRLDYVAPVASVISPDHYFHGTTYDLSIQVNDEDNAIDDFANVGGLVGPEHNLVFKWRRDSFDTWKEFEPAGALNITTSPVDVNGDKIITFHNWDTYLVDVNDVYNHEGNVEVTVEITDIHANWSEAALGTVYIDNEAPDVPVTEVAYSSYDFLGTNSWHAINSEMYEESNNTVTISLNQMDDANSDDEEAFIRFRVHQTQILNLSDYQLPVGQSNGDLAMPIMAYHGTGNADSLQVMDPNFILYDHVPDADGWFTFSVLLNNAYPPGYHYFALVAKDIREDADGTPSGNLDGDSYPFEGNLSTEEFRRSWDLRVNLLNDVAVPTEIVNPQHGIVGGWINLAAVDSRAPIGTMEFQYSTTGHADDWNSIAFVARNDSSYAEAYIHLRRDELPQFDDMPFIPGIHVYQAIGNRDEGEGPDGPQQVSLSPLAELTPPQLDDQNGIWDGMVRLPKNEEVIIKFVPDMNDNGEIEGDELALAFDHPNPWFRTIRTSSFMTPYNTMTERLASGYYYFRAVPDGDPRAAAMTLLFVDNDAPVVELDIVGSETLYAVGDNVQLVTDIDELYIVEDDLLNVVYQISAQAPGTENRQWNTINQNLVNEGDFTYTHTLPSPLIDDLDNDGDGHIDEPDEVSGIFYFRTYAYDQAGNYGYSDEQWVMADGSEPKMHVTSVDGVIPAGEQVIIPLPEDGTIELVATDVTPNIFDTVPSFFDGAVEAMFEYQIDHGQWMKLYDVNGDSVFAVVNGEAMITVDTSDWLENYYAFRAHSIDRVDNTDSDPYVTPVLFNDEIGPEGTITTVGGYSVFDNSYVFIPGAEQVTVAYDLNGVFLPTITFEVFNAETQIWDNITTIANPDTMGTFTWTPVDGADVERSYQIRIKPEDEEANDTEIPVTVYVDNTAPALADTLGFVASPIVVANGFDVLHVEQDTVRTVLSYIADQYHGMYDLKNVRVTIRQDSTTTTQALITRGIGQWTYQIPGTTGNAFQANLAGTTNTGWYTFVVEVTDFADNSDTLYFHNGIVIDNDGDPNMFGGSPVLSANPADFVYEESYAGEHVAVNTDISHFTLYNWYDNIVGVESAQLNISYVTTDGDTLIDVVPGVINHADTTVAFEWDPTNLEDVISTDETPKAINIEVAIYDYLDHETTFSYITDFELIDADPSQARILYFQNALVGENMVDWQTEPGNVTISGLNGDLHAFVPVDHDFADSVRFEWINPNTQLWEEIGTVATSGLVNPPFENVGGISEMYTPSDEYICNWDISDLTTGQYTVRAIAIDRSGLEDATPLEVNVHISNDYDLPMPYVYDADGNVTNELVRGEFYNLEAIVNYSEMITGITFKYRYDDDEIDRDGTWFVIGADEDMESPYFFNDWLINRDMIPGLTIKVIAMPTFNADLTDTTYTEEELLAAGLYVPLTIVDVTAPVIAGVQIDPDQAVFGMDTWIDEDVVDTIKVDIFTEYNEIVTRDTTEQNDIDRIILSYRYAPENPTRMDTLYRVLETKHLTTAEELWSNPYTYKYTNFDGQNHNGWDISTLPEGIYDIMVEVFDSADNMSVYNHKMYIDRTAPVTESIEILPVEGEGVVDYFERGEDYLIDYTATHEHPGMFAYYTFYVREVNTLGNVVTLWDTIPGAVQTDASEITFTIPEDTEFGHWFEFYAVGTDMAGHMTDPGQLDYEPTAMRQVMATNLPAVITQVGGVNYIPGMHVNGEDIAIASTIYNQDLLPLINYVGFFMNDGVNGWELIETSGVALPTDLPGTAGIPNWDVMDIAHNTAVQITVIPVADPENVVELPFDENNMNIYVANVLVDHEAPVVDAVPVPIAGPLNGEEFYFEAQTNDNDFDYMACELWYVMSEQADVEEAWQILDNDPDFGGLNANENYYVRYLISNPGTFFVDGAEYDFKVKVKDTSVDEANETFVNVNVDPVLIDMTDPEGYISEVFGNLLPFTEPIEVPLHDDVHLTGFAWDPGVDAGNASGIDHVEFYWTVEAGMPEHMIASVDNDGDNYYDATWNTTGLLIDEEYVLIMKAYDAVGNEIVDSVNVIIVPASDPVAVISGFDFDGITANHDWIYAVSKDCVDNPTNYVRFEYQINGGAWVPFATTYYDTAVVVNGMVMWKAEFNADDMGVVGANTLLRAVAVKADGEDSDETAPVLHVEYSADMGGMFITDTNDAAIIFYDDVVHIDSDQYPYILAMNEVQDAAQTSDVVQLLDPLPTFNDNEYDFTAEVEINPADTYVNVVTIWTATTNNGMINLEKARLNVYPLTEASGSNGTLVSEDEILSVNVPVHGGMGWIYFEPVHEDDEIPYDAYETIADQEAIHAAVEVDTNFAVQMTTVEMAINEILTDADFYAYRFMIYRELTSGWGWDYVTATVDADSMVAHAEIDASILDGEGVIVTVAAVPGFMPPTPYIEYVSVMNEWIEAEADARTRNLRDPGDIWTSFASPEWAHWEDWLAWLMFPFYGDKPYDGPGEGRSAGRLNPPNLQPMDGVVFDFKTYILPNGDEYEVDPSLDIDIYVDGIRIVDDGEVDENWADDSIEIDEISGMFHVKVLNREYLEATELHTIEAIVDNGFESATTGEIEFMVDSSYPHVDNNSDENLNYIRHNMTISATITDEQSGIDPETIHLALINPELGDINVEVDSLGFPDFNTLNIPIPILIDFASMDHAVIEDGYELSYELTLDDLQMVMTQYNNDVNEIYAVWIASNNVNMYSFMDLGFNPQVYIVDVAAPVAWAISPVGAPIDNDGDQLFNEDPINGVNEDLDFDDWNNNGVQDGMWVSDSLGTHWVGEPAIIDEDPIDYEADELEYGTDVVIAVGYDDIPMPTVVSGCADCPVWYSGACGVDTSNIVVTLNGNEIDDVPVIINNGVWQAEYDFETNPLDPGHYVVIASIPDMVGNVGSVTFEFEINGPAPTVTFNPLTEDSWWFNPTSNDLDFTFTVHATGGIEIAEDGVIVNFYAEPSGTLLQGPMTLHLESNEYMAHLGTDIPANQYGVRLEVIATNIMGETSESNQTYLIDNQAPSIAFISPENDANFDLGESVSIVAEFSDVQADRSRSKSAKSTTRLQSKAVNRTNGSGIAEAVLKVYKPNGELLSDPVVENSGNVIEVNTAALTTAGVYNVRLIVTDKVGNESIETLNFEINAVAPMIEIVGISSENDLYTAGDYYNPDQAITFNAIVRPSTGADFDVYGTVLNIYRIYKEEGVITEALVNEISVPMEMDSLGVYPIEYVINQVNHEEDLGMRVEVIAQNVLNDVRVMSQTYHIDDSVALISIISPEDDQNFDLGATVNIVAEFYDNDNIRSNESSSQLRLSTKAESRNNGSGIREAMLKVYAPNGSALLDETVTGVNTINTVTSTLTDGGIYSLSLKVIDNVGNEKIETLTFEVNVSAPLIQITGISSADDMFTEGDFYNPNKAVTFNAVVRPNAGAAIDENATELRVYRIFKVEGAVTEALVNEVSVPMTLSEGVYPIEYVVSQINHAGDLGMRIEVSAKNVLNDERVMSQVYNLDDCAPQVSIVKPLDGAVFESDVNTVTIEADYNDEIMEALTRSTRNSTRFAAKGNSRDGNSSGIDVDMVTLKVDNIVINENVSISENKLILSKEFGAGLHEVEVIVFDNVGNSVSETWSFTIKAVQVFEELSVTDAHTYPNPVEEGHSTTFSVGVNKDADVSIVIYDFAGNQVRELYSGVYYAQSRDMITWDGCTDEGTKVARGAYFARVLISDGLDRIEKIVKIAIIK